MLIILYGDGVIACYLDIKHCQVLQNISITICSFLILFSYFVRSVAICHFVNNNEDLYLGSVMVQIYFETSIIAVKKKIGTKWHKTSWAKRPKTLRLGQNFYFIFLSLDLGFYTCLL